MGNPKGSPRRKTTTRRGVSAPAGATVRPIVTQQPVPNLGAGQAVYGANGGQTNLSNGSQFPPGEPLQPMAGVVPADGGPRQWPYAVGYNIAQRPRATEMTAFETLRNLAALYDGIQLCERVYFDLLGRLELIVLPRKELMAQGADATDAQWQQPIAAITDFLDAPDRTQDLRAWMCAFVRDILEIDAVGVYRRRDRANRLYALELVAGDSLKPLIEEHGRIPAPPNPAYQQFLYGVPAGWYTVDELDYIKETNRTESVYGLSRVERIILRVNQALRKQDFDLARFTDGSTPLGIIAPPADIGWTPEQLRTFEQTFNGLLAGNDQARVRARALPPGATFESLQADNPLVDYDRYLLNVTVAAFGLTMDELGMTDTSNRSVGQTQEAVIYRRAVAPVTGLIAAYLTRVVRKEIDNRFTVSFGGFEEPEDFATRAEALAKLIPTGAISGSEAARLLRLPVKKDTPAYILAGNQVVLVEDLLNGNYTAASQLQSSGGGAPAQSVGSQGGDHASATPTT